MPGDFFTAFGASVLGPLVAGFARWAVRQWRPFAGRGTLVAVMRDGSLLGRAVARNAGPVGEVWLARSHCLQGAVAGAGDREALTNLLVRARARPATVGEALGILGLEDARPPGLADGEPLSGPVLERLLDWLAGTPSVAAHVADSARAARRALLGHLRSCGALARPVLGLLDIGYAGTVQRCLLRIASIEGIPLHLLGLYLATTPGAVWAARTGSDVRGFVLRYGAPGWLAEPLVRSRELLELLCTAPCGPLEGFDGDRPRLGPSPYPAEQAAAMARLQDAALTASSRPLGQTAARHALHRLITAPMAAEAAHLGRWICQDRLAVPQPRRLADRCGAASPIAGRDHVLWPAATEAAERP